jgi:WD40 repeat protein
VAVLHLQGDGRTTELDRAKEQATESCFTDLNAGPMPFSADGRRVTSGTSDRVACVWDANDGRLLHVLGDGCPCHRSVASFSPSGRWVIVQQYDSVMTEVWDAETGKLQCQLPHSSAFHVPMRFLPFPPRPGAAEYAIVGMGASDYSWPLRVNVVSEWDVKKGAVRSQFRLPGKQSFQRSFAEDGTACHWGQRTEQDDISLDANWVLRLEDDVVRVFARVETEEASETPSEYGYGYTEDRRIGYTAGGQTLVDSRTDREVASLGPHERYLFSADGRFLVAVSHAGDNPLLRVWDARTAVPRFTISDYRQRITTLQFQPVRALLLVGSADHTVRLWSLETGVEVARATVDAPDEPSYEAAITADGTKVAFATSGRLHVWHIDRRETVHAPTTLYARDPRFSADGRWLLAADEDVAHIWDTTTMESVGEFPWHFAMVVSGDLSPDMKLAATYGLDYCVRLWEAPGGREITHWKIPGNLSGCTLRFSEDGTYLYGPNCQRLIVDVQRLINLAKTRVFRTLSPAERRLFLGERET